MYVRVSLGTLFSLGLERGNAEATPGVAYVMQYSDKVCAALCSFCSQSYVWGVSKEFLSRIVWPVREVGELIRALKTSPIRRVCVQTVIKEGFLRESHELVSRLNKAGKEVSLAITPIPRRELIKLRDEGVDYLGIGLDAVSPRVARRALKPYPWSLYLSFVKVGLEVYGTGRVVTHLIIGMGETYEEILQTIDRLNKMGSEISLFAFTPLKGTLMEHCRPPTLRKYRFSQLALYLIKKGLRWEDFVVFRNQIPFIRSKYVPSFNDAARAFLTRGCPGCNRPFYNESPGKEPYNLPSKKLLERWRRRVKKSLKELIVED